MALIGVRRTYLEEIFWMKRSLNMFCLFLEVKYVYFMVSFHMHLHVSFESLFCNHISCKFSNVNPVKVVKPISDLEINH